MDVTYLVSPDVGLVFQEVTGVDNTEKLDLLRSIGADQAIDYTQEDFTPRIERLHNSLEIHLHCH